MFSKVILGQLMAEMINTLAGRNTSQWDHKEVKKRFKMNTNEVSMWRNTHWQETRQLHTTGEVQPGPKKETERIWVKGVSTARAAEL